MKFPFIRHGTFVIIILMMSAGSCRKAPSELILEGKTMEYGGIQPLSGVALSVEQRVVDGAVFIGAYSLAASTTTSADGTYRMAWPRTQLAGLRLLTSRSGYIPVTLELSPDDFAPGETVYQNIRLRPEAFITMNLRNSGPGYSEDLLRFRFYGETYNCACCSAEWREFTGADVDTSLTCRVYGNQWARYWAEVVSPDGNQLVLDSVWCPAFQTTSVEFDY